ncbi:MAG TPA: M28 family peptidase [Polyangiaceae bacterium]|nr:M28 family peptidase [Polyangiaceae bacterium]
MDRHIEKLSVTIGERHAGKAWELADAADDLASELEGLGYVIERQGYEWGGALAQNLAVTIPGGTRGAERVVVGAHYDGPPTGRGVTSAVSTAALLELAHLMQGARMERTLSLVFFGLGADPQLSPEARGARHFVRQLARRGGQQPTQTQSAPADSTGNVVAALLLENLLLPGVPHDLPVQLTVAVSPLAVKWEAVLAGSIDDELMVLSRGPWPTVESDGLAFSEHGIPSVVTGEPALREEANAASSLALDRAARALLRIRYALGDWVIERPTNDAMVTPTGTQLE